MDELKIIRWGNFDENYKMRSYDKEELEKIINLVSKELIDNNICFSGEFHQTGMNGMPIFSDGTCFRASMRAWGNIMANVKHHLTGEEYSYMDFYMGDSDSNLPNPSKKDVEPIEVEEPSFGLFIKQDQDLVIESVAMGMPLMTTDKIVKEIYEYIKNNQGE